MFDCFWLSVPVQLIAWKDLPSNDLLCVEWDVKHAIYFVEELLLRLLGLVVIIGNVANE